MGTGLERGLPGKLREATGLFCQDPGELGRPGPCLSGGTGNVTQLGGHGTTLVFLGKRFSYMESIWGHSCMHIPGAE